MSQHKDAAKTLRNNSAAQTTATRPSSHDSFPHLPHAIFGDGSAAEAVTQSRPPSHWSNRLFPDHSSLFRKSISPFRLFLALIVLPARRCMGTLFDPTQYPALSFSVRRRVLRITHLHRRAVVRPEVGGTVPCVAALAPSRPLACRSEYRFVRPVRL